MSIKGMDDRWIIDLYYDLPIAFWFVIVVLVAMLAWLIRIISLDV